MLNRIGTFNNNTTPPRLDFDAYAKKYAKQNGISEEEAKTELKVRFGDKKTKEVASFNILNEQATSPECLDYLFGVDSSNKTDLPANIENKRFTTILEKLLAFLENDDNIQNKNAPDINKNPFQN